MARGGYGQILFVKLIDRRAVAASAFPGSISEIMPLLCRFRTALENLSAARTRNAASCFDNNRPAI